MSFPLLNLDFLLRPTHAKVGLANLDFYLHCTKQNLDRAIREIEEAANLSSQREAKLKLLAWMDNNLHGQSLIVGYYEQCCLVLAEVEKIVLQLKEEHYPRVSLLTTPTLQRDELEAFLRQINEESISLATRHLVD